jgi:hypothetical protein
VSEASLVELAEEIDLGHYILLNRGEEKTGGRRKRALLADAYEALIGALYVDGGVTVAERFLRRELREKLTAIDPASMIGADYKSALQERLQAIGGPAPDYQVVEVFGPDHRRTFRVELRVGGHALATGEGHTIKLAQQEAARVALTENDLVGEDADDALDITDQEEQALEPDDYVTSSKQIDDSLAHAGTAAGDGRDASQKTVAASLAEQEVDEEKAAAAIIEDWKFYEQG